MSQNTLILVGCIIACVGILGFGFLYDPKKNQAAQQANPPPQNPSGGADELAYHAFKVIHDAAIRGSAKEITNRLAVAQTRQFTDAIAAGVQPTNNFGPATQRSFPFAGNDPAATDLFGSPVKL